VEARRSTQRVRHIRLTDEGSEILREQHEAFQALKRDAFGALLEDVADNQAEWEAALVQMAAEFFCLLGKEYTAVLTRRADYKDIVGRSTIRKLARRIARSRKGIGDQELARMFEKLLLEQTPKRAEFIWIAAYGYFSLVALGLGNRVSIPVREYLRDNHILLDTNVLFPALVEGMTRHSSISQFLALCERLGARVVVSSVTQGELARSAAHQADIADRMNTEVLVSLCEDGDDPLLAAVGNIGVDSTDLIPAVIRNFRSLASKLKDCNNLQIIEDLWFKNAEDSDRTIEMAAEVNRVHREMREWLPPKSKRVALHDALMLLYVEREHAEGRDAVFATLDATLPHCRIEGMEDAPPVAVTLDALLQWATPDLSDSEVSQTAAEVFAVALAERFIPVDSKISLEDWNTLDQLQVDCNGLPHDDVLDCAAFLRRLVVKHDPSTAEGKLRVAGDLRKFLAQPERHYRKDMEESQEIREQATGMAKRYRLALRILIGIILLLVGILVAIALGKGETLLARWRDGWGAYLVLGGALPFVRQVFRGILSIIRRSER
jgi:predicted nucleic acid-binding protein